MSSQELVASANFRATVLLIVQLHHQRCARTVERKVCLHLYRPIHQIKYSHYALLGHSILACKNPRKIDRSGIEVVQAEAAWEEITAAVGQKDMDDVKEAFLKYVKACPIATYSDLEDGFRTMGIPLYIIAMERELAPTYTNMDLQGNLDKTYTVSLRFSPEARRPKEALGWPESPEENMERLKDAGQPVDRGIPKCNNCEELGHVSKSCPEDKREPTDRASVTCFNCEEAGHRMRDCKSFQKCLRISG